MGIEDTIQGGDAGPLALFDDVSNHAFVKPLTEAVCELIKNTRAQIEAQSDRQTQWNMVAGYMLLLDQKSTGGKVNADEIRGKLKLAEDGDLKRYK